MSDEHAMAMKGILNIFSWIDKPVAAPKLIMGGVQVESDDEVTAKFCKPVQDFLRYCNKTDIGYELWEHPESNGKLDIGYTLSEVAITKAYAKDDLQTHFFVFVRKDDNASLRLPKAVIRGLVGTIEKMVMINGVPTKINKSIDVIEAEEQARKNLEGVMTPGGIGPFPINGTDHVYIDLNTYEERHASLVNLATGSPTHSFNMKLDDLVRALNHFYGSRVQIIDLFEQGKSTLFGAALKIWTKTFFRELDCTYTKNK